jgi:hypothetical protein
MLIYPYGAIGTINISTDAIFIDLLPPLGMNSIRLEGWTKDIHGPFKAIHSQSMAHEEDLSKVQGEPCTVILDTEEGSETLKVIFDGGKEVWYTVGPEALYAIREKVDELTHKPLER